MLVKEETVFRFGSTETETVEIIPFKSAHVSIHSEVEQTAEDDCEGCAINFSCVLLTSRSAKSVL